MANNKKIHQGLIKKEAEEELMDAMFAPAKTAKDLLRPKVISLKHQIKTYILQEAYSPSKTFATYLKKYMATVGKSHKELANDISVHPSRFARILQGNEEIRLSIIFRLEQHSGNIIPALLWWHLVQRDVDQQIMKDTTEREKAHKFVKNIVC